ncbi:leucine-rich repeat extensin-like protein 5 [Coccidioides immitis RS]|uniref:Leucine-rich repeat extensin-like protein 5 n=1 Tax=Coccidioides immitis (strain RS) TaxID=246410 RepID=A0A0E1S0M1_COCIM|nr:leucine-rich repeat extensin-like protein 5 [Coccidioides immitis RS]EAS36621.1 leucine-rich repeat extensin-like protein 5 [Coccidioides immitis RS]TPX25288.1 hypothetical protein DIZ76_010739 [Coccidioides immitis]
MTSFKDASNARPFGQSSTPHTRQSSGRLHSHSISLGVVNTNHRVTRRKSMTSTANVAAVAAALGGSPASQNPLPTTSYHRRGLSSRKVGLESTSMGSSSSALGSYIAQQRKNSPNSAVTTAGNNTNTTTTTTNNNNININSNNNQSGEETSSTSRPISTKHRSRRASEGSHLIRGEGKRSLTELKCDRCGKGYKHSSCLTKHMWEHDPAWAYTSKLLISKHQQVQLLEAATVLVNMNQEPTPSDHARSGDSDRSSASPTASGISELRDELSSTETTPPPAGDESMTKLGDHHRFGSSAFSRSFQSMPSSSFAGSAPSYSPARSHFRQSSIDTRPSTAGTGVLDDDEAGLAAAIELCNFGTPRTGANAMSSDVPPVPPLPARYLSQSMNNSSHAGGGAHNTARSFDVRSTTSKDASSTPTMFNPFLINPPLSYKISDERDVKMGDVKPIHEEDDNFDRDSVVPMDEDDDGVFGKMEE